MGWADADVFCKQAGRRLCSRAELELGVCAATGCGYDAATVHSSTAAHADGDFPPSPPVTPPTPPPPPAPPPASWLLGQRGASCDAACAAAGLTCSLERILAAGEMIMAIFRYI